MEIALDGGGLVVLYQALCQLIKEREWMEMHEKVREVITQIKVTQAGEEVAGLGRVAWRKTPEESASLAQIERENKAFNRRSALLESVLKSAGLTSTRLCANV